MDSGWKTELRNKIDWNNITLPEIGKIMNQVQKKSFYYLKMMTYYFLMQSHQSNKTHSDVLKQVEGVVELRGVVTKENFLLDNQRLIVD